MKLVRLKGDVLVQGEGPEAVAGPGEVRIRVYAAGIILTELGWYPTRHTKDGAVRDGAVPAHEFSGVVVESGEEVFGMNDWFADGALAEFCTAPVTSIAPKPRGLTHVEAASVPISALTAWQGLVVRASVQANERVLIHGGAGAVGIFAVQIAKLQGAHVIATASGSNRDFVLGLGADEVIDYQAVRFEEQVRDVDVVFDTVGGSTLDRSFGVLNAGGRLVTVVSGAEGSSDPRIKNAFFIVEPDREQLTKIGTMLEDGKLRTVIDVAVPLSQAADLYAGKVTRQHRGKLVVTIPA